MTKKTTTIQFIERSNIIHKNKFDYSKTIYTTTHSSVIISCPIHGEFQQTALLHLRGLGCSQCSSSTRKQTNLERHGVENPNQLKKFREKAKRTNLIRYGVEHPSQSEEVMNKQKQTNLERYGVEHFNNSEKTKQTNLERYGHENIAHGVLREKVIQTNLDRYGVENPSQQNMINILPLIEDVEWMTNQYVTHCKSATQIALELGINVTTICNYLHTHQIPTTPMNKHSYKSDRWIKSIIESENIYIQHAGNIGEYSIPNSPYHADGFCAETNTIYEFYGDYWHGNPNKYAPDFINQVKDMTMGEIYQKTIIRENKIKYLGYNLITMWESDYTG